MIINQDLLDHRLLTQEEILVLAAKMKDGDITARNKLVMHNLKLISKAVKKYQNCGLSDEDMLSEAIAIVLSHMQLYDPERGKISTFISQCIKTKVRQQLFLKGAIISLPEELVKTLYLWKKEKSRCRYNNIETPSLVEFAKARGYNKYQIECLRAVHKLRKQIVDIGQSNSDEVKQAVTLLADRGNCPTKAIEGSDKAKIITQAIAKLPAQFRAVINLRFGLEDGIQRSRPEVAAELKQSEYRVRMIEDQALRRLRLNDKIKEFAIAS